MTPPSRRPHYMTEHPRFQRWLRDVTLSDDIVMEVCLHNNTTCATLMLRIILEREDLLVKEVSVQKTIPNLYGHGVRFDILAADEAGRLYDIEMQVGGTTEELALRARMYSSMLDLHQLKAGEDYKELREHWVIFIVDRDLFGHGLPQYWVEHCVLGGREGEGGLIRLFGDGAHILFVNSTLRDRGTALSYLMHDMHCPDPARMHYPELAAVLRYHKIQEEGVDKMSEAYARLEKEIAAELAQEIGAEYLAQGIERGIAIGEERGIAIGEERGIAIGEERGMARGMEESKRLFALRLLENGFALEQIADYTTLPLEDVRALAAKGTKRP